MGFWNKLGKIALQAAPYVAAPFTAGTSLMATGLTNQLGQKWAQHDAEKAIAKGIAPSKFDKYLGMASAGAGLASSLTGGFGGALLGKAGKAASTASKLAGSANKVSGFANALGKINTATNAIQGAGAIANQFRGSGGGGEEPTSGSLPEPSSRSGLPPVGQAQPRNTGGLASIFARGRNEAVANQPFRRGYETVVQGDDDTTLTHTMPPIYPNYGPPPSDDGAAPTSVFNEGPAATPIQNVLRDELTPRRMARRRNPVQEEE